MNVTSVCDKCDSMLTDAVKVIVTIESVKNVEKTQTQSELRYKHWDERESFSLVQG